MKILSYFLSTIFALVFYIELIIFQPLISGSAGNVATQTLAVTLKMFAKNEEGVLKNSAREIFTGMINGFVIGISGGIDSAVTSTLCAKTGLKLLCIEMPIHQAKSHVSRGQEHIAQLKERFSNVSDTCVDLTPVFEEIEIGGNEDADVGTITIEKK